MSWRAGLEKAAMAVAVLALAVAASIVTSPLASAGTITFTPSSGSIDVAGSAGFTQQLTPTGNSNPVTYTSDETGSSQLTITGGGLISVVNGPIAVGTYNISGTSTDGTNTGDWAYSLTVTPDTIASSPTSGTVDVAGSASFTQQLTASDNGSPVAYSQGGTSQSPQLSITGGGLISVVSGPIAVGTYNISGTSTDGLSDTGNWAFQLSVTADTIVQGSPISGTTNAQSSASFSTTLSATTGAIGSVTFSTTTPDFIISNGDELETTGALSAGASPYVVTGTDVDAKGDTGTWTYTLTVNPPVTGGGGGGGGGASSINQTSPATGTVSTTSSASFTSGPITTDGNVGTVTFATTKSSGLTVSASGLITTTGTLAAGTYTVSGTDSDAHGNSGTWTFTLTVTQAAVVVTVTFDANGGTGAMAPESASAPTSLALNHFVRKGFVFVDWNTAADGSGVSYANGALFPFRAATTLFAQWKRGRSPKRTITFAANGGVGSTASEIENTPTAIKASHYTRAGYVFVGWNTSAKGTGRRFKAGATYPFTKSITLYAQWKKIPKAPPPKAPPSFVVIFLANGGSGKMAVEKRHGPSTLTPDRFTRAGYTFVDWNTAANGKGPLYANGATYPFRVSTNLYAQWKKNKVAPPPTPAIPGGVIIGPFAAGSTALSAALESEIQSLALEAQAKRDTQITLYGFGDGATGAANTDLGRRRAGVMATYLESRLTAVGLKGWTISIATTSPSTSEISSVVATLS